MNYFELCREEEYKKILEAHKENKWVCLKGETDSGKTTMLRRLFDDSLYTIKIMQGGSDIKWRHNINSFILDSIKRFRNKVNDSIVLFLEEYDEINTLTHIIEECKKMNVDVVITLKSVINQNIRDYFFIYDLPPKFTKNQLTKFANKYLDSVSIIDEISDFNIGDMLEFEKILEKFDYKENADFCNMQLIINKVKDMREERQAKKRFGKHSMTLIHTNEYREIRLLDFSGSKESINYKLL